MEASMTGADIGEDLEAVRERYSRGTKKEKGRILDELVGVAGCHRKSAVRMLRRGRPASQARSGRGPAYKGDVVEVLRMAWEAADHLCSRRLQPFLPELLPVLQRCGNRQISAELATRLCRMSPSTIDRLLRPWRRSAARHRFSVTRPGTRLKMAIPVKAFAQWDEARPGFLEVHLVHHCGARDDGHYLTTLCAADVATGWSECMAVRGKGQGRICEAIERLRERLPVPLLGLDCDFINRNLLAYCQRHQTSFARSHPHREHGIRRVEQKNWSIARRIIGHDRYSSGAALEAMDQIYGMLRLYVNFFQPTMKLAGKTWHRSRAGKVYARKVYAPAQTPYRRLLASGLLSDDRRRELAAIYDGLNPILLRQQLDDNLKRLRDLAARPALSL